MNNEHPLITDITEILSEDGALRIAADIGGRVIYGTVTLVEGDWLIMEQPPGRLNVNAINYVEYLEVG